MSDIDFTNMDLPSSKDFLLALMTTIKQTETKIASFDTELTLWKGRIVLAQNNNKSDLEAQAYVRVKDIEFEMDTLKTEIIEFRGEFERLKRHIQMIKNQPEFTVDADLLLAQMEMVVGEPDELAEKFKKEEANAELEKLKKEMGETE